MPLSLLVKESSPMTTTGTVNQTGAFDDAGQLGTVLQDERAEDTLTLSSADDAKAIVEAFRSSGATGPWTNVDRTAYADRLAAVLADPRVITQGALNLCGPAAFFNIVAGRHPVAVAQGAAALYESGKCDIGGLHIEAKSDLLAADYTAMVAAIQAKSDVVAPPADYVLLGALRNATNPFWQPDWKGNPDQELAGMTRPEELAAWFRATGFFATVTDGGKWATNPGIPSAMNLSCAAGTDNALLVNANVLASVGLTGVDNSFILRSFPNHWVVLRTEIIVDVTPAADGTPVIDTGIWTWGASSLGLKFPQQLFADNYYGAVTTVLPSQGG